MYHVGYRFSLESLIAPQPMNASEMHNFIALEKFTNIPVRELTTGKEVEIHEMEREFLIAFILSSLARYKIDMWQSILDAKKDDRITGIRRHLNLIQLFFPNWILTMLHRRIIYFARINKWGF